MREGMRMKTFSVESQSLSTKRSLKGSFLRRCAFPLALVFLLLLSSGFTLSDHTPSYSHAAPNIVTFSISNFTTALLSTTADDLSSANCCLFHIQNGTPWWYSIVARSAPKGIQLQPAVAQNDLVTATFFGTIPLLPPVNVLPFDQQGTSFAYEELQLQATLYGPDQRLQLTLTPFEVHAIMLDILGFLPRVLGLRMPAMQMGLLIPGTLTEVLALATTMKDFSALTSDYIAVLDSMPDAVKGEKSAQAFANDMKTLLMDPVEQGVLGDILWKVEGKVLTHESILSVLQSFSQVQFELAVSNFILDTALTQEAIFDQHHLPTIVLQTPITITPTPKPTATPTPTPTPKPTATPMPTPTPKLMPTPTPIPTLVPTPVSTASASASPPLKSKTTSKTKLRPVPITP